jgi:IS605 OrfB family transposase
LRFNANQCRLSAMKLTAMVKLQPTAAQRALLYETLTCANAACNAISREAWASKTFGRWSLHDKLYARLRAESELAAQVVVRCLAKVVDAYKADHSTPRQFRKLGAIPYDSRVLSYRLSDQTVSIWLLGGRQSIRVAAGDHHRALLAHQQGESDLVYRKGAFYLYATCELPAGDPLDATGWLGVDLGIVNLATDSDGETFSGSTIHNVRGRHRRLRRRLQRKRTLGARRRLRQLAGQERRFAAHTNHTISKRLVDKARRHSLGIALEDLSGIRERVTVQRAQRSTLHTWSFFQLRAFLDYKAQRAGIPLVAVDPRNTSRTCPACGCVEPANRRSQALFLCVQCGFAAHADHVAAVNIARRANADRGAAVDRPYYSDGG